MTRTVDYLRIARRHLAQSPNLVRAESVISAERSPLWDGVLLHSCSRCGESATNEELTLVATPDEPRYSARFVHRTDCGARS